VTCARCQQPAVVQAIESHGTVGYCQTCACARAREVGHERRVRPGAKREASARWLNVEGHRLGLLGELAFARRYHLAVDLRARVNDSGVDFATAAGTVDVKTNSSPKHPNILVPADAKIRADIYVLACVWRKTGVQLMGWCRRSLVEAAPIKQLVVPTRVVAAPQLNAIEALDALLLPPGEPVRADEITW